MSVCVWAKVCGCGCGYGFLWLQTVRAQCVPISGELHMLVGTAKPLMFAHSTRTVGQVLQVLYDTNVTVDDYSS